MKLMKMNLMYHGTRCPVEVLWNEGLRFDSEALEKLAHKTAKIIGVDYCAWASNGKEFGMIMMGAPTGYWLSPILRGEITERCTIRATPSIEMARSYAQRAPEVITNTFNSMWNFKHGFDDLHDLSETKPKTYRSFMRSIGVPKLVVINPDHPAMGGRCKREHDVHLTFVPPEAILEIEPIPDFPDFPGSEDCHAILVLGEVP